MRLDNERGNLIHTTSDIKFSFSQFFNDGVLIGFSCRETKREVKNVFRFSRNDSSETFFSMQGDVSTKNSIRRLEQRERKVAAVHSASA